MRIHFHNPEDVGRVHTVDLEPGDSVQIKYAMGEFLDVRVTGRATIDLHVRNFDERRMDDYRPPKRRWNRFWEKS